MRNGCRSYNRHGPKFCGLASPRRAAVTEFWRFSPVPPLRARTFRLIDILLIFQYSRPAASDTRQYLRQVCICPARDAAPRNTSVMCNNVRRSRRFTAAHFCRALCEAAEFALISTMEPSPAHRSLIERRTFPHCARDRSILEAKC